MLTQELRSAIAKVDSSFKGEGGKLDFIVAEALKNEKENLKDILQHAATFGNIEVVKSLIEKMPDLEERRQMIFADDCQAIRNAADKEDLRIVALFIRATQPTSEEFYGILRSGKCQMLNPISGKHEVPVFFAVMLMKPPKELEPTLKKCSKEILEFREIKKILTEKFASNGDSSVSPDEKKKQANRMANDALAVLFTFNAAGVGGLLSRGQYEIVSAENGRIRSMLPEKINIPQDAVLFAPKKKEEPRPAPREVGDDELVVVEATVAEVEARKKKTVKESEWNDGVVVRKANTNKVISFGDDITVKKFVVEAEFESYQPDDHSSEDYEEQPKPSVKEVERAESLKNNTLLNKNLKW